MLKFLLVAGLVAFSYAQTLGPGVPDNRCPPHITPDPPLHLNDPSDCSRFFTCVAGRAVPVACPPGQHWSIAANACDWPERARCEEGTTCPPGDPQPPVLLPHESDCGMFYKCSWGVPMPISCPPGQHWSVEHNWCDFPDRANCQLGSTTTGGDGGSRTTTRATTTTRRRS